MHISGAHLHGQAQHPAANAAGFAAKLAADTRKKLFTVAEELDASATAESAWMIGAWAGGSGSGGNGNEARHGERGQGEAGYERPTDGSGGSGAAIPEVALEQSAIAGAQSAFAASAAPGVAGPALGYSGYGAGERVERTPEVRQVSYWA